MKTRNSLSCLAAVLVPAIAVAQSEDFSGGNPDNWTFDDSDGAVAGTGGHPGPYLLDPTVQGGSPNPILWPRVPVSQFSGDLRAMSVTSAGFDVRVNFGSAPAGTFIYVIVADNGGTVDDIGDDCYAYASTGVALSGPSNWVVIDVDVPTAMTTVPAGWALSANCVGAPDVVWNALVQDADYVGFMFGDPAQDFAVSFSVCVDNVRFNGDGSVGDTYCIASPNSTGSPAAISAAGSPSVTADDLTLVAQPLPAFQNGVFFYGPDQVQNPFGNGFQCVGAGATGIARLAIENAGPGGVLEHALDFGAPPTVSTQITAGSTWQFQAWFRDPAAGGAFFNLSDGLTVDFVP